MEEMDFNSYLHQRYQDAKKRELQRLKEAKHKRNVAAVVDFASSLISLVGRRRGARYPIATNSLSKYQELYDNMRERYNSVMQDYKAAIADNNLRQRISSNGAAVETLPQIRTVPFVTSGINGSQGAGSFRTGSLENFIRNYYSVNN